jgi:hypothetical protein
MTRNLQGAALVLHRRNFVSPRLVGALFSAGLICWAAYLFADGSGKTGYSDYSRGCSCHNSSPNSAGAVTVSISGPQTVQPGSKSGYTISVSGGPSGTTGGFDLSATGGTFTAGTGDQVSSGEMTHTNNSRRSWTFQWTAPSTPGTYSFAAVGLASNGSSSSGDSWNWYGNSAGAPFTITVSGPTGDTTRPGAVTDLQ